MSKYENNKDKDNNRLVFFELKTTQDLINKAKADFEELKKHPWDSYRAFNFFVTVEHIPDWLKAKTLRKKYAILRIVSHLANGAKHFELDPKRHKSVTKAERERVYEEGVYEEDIFYDQLVVHLEDDEKEKLNLLKLEDNKIDIITLGELALNFWLEFFKENYTNTNC